MLFTRKLRYPDQFFGNGFLEPFFRIYSLVLKICLSGNFMKNTSVRINEVSLYCILKLQIKEDGCSFRKSGSGCTGMQISMAFAASSGNFLQLKKFLPNIKI